ncbi:MAG: hypothetical protein CMH57_01060 [Myxococcales bacterium]|nr:hypothetical protein [Myxococcales bacterium]
MTVAATWITATGCSFLLDFDECSLDEDCGDPAVSCVANRCVIAESEQITVSGELTSDQIWTSDSTYVLEGLVYVLPPATLTIEPGTRILGQNNSALVVTPGASLEARGRPDEPIVFTSARPEGERRAGDWGGVALLGEAPTNEDGSELEGLNDPTYASFGGDNPDTSCGVLQYVRIEFAGFALKRDEELNGLTLAGCGAQTIVEFVQVHFGLDDGVEVFGGNVELNHIVITRAQDDSLDWDRGWTGRAQFLAIQQDEGGDNGIEADNWETDNDASPRSSPTLYNVTLIGSGADSGGQRAITFKQGTAGSINNSLILGHPQEAIDVAGEVTVAQLEADALRVRNTMFFDIGSTGTHYFPTQDDETELEPDDGRDDDGGFDEALHFQQSRYSNTFGQDPRIPDPYNLVAPGWVPQADATVPGIAPPPGFDEGADYLGAFEPGADTLWTDGWTAYPEN